jgi:hypothetical protein
MPQGHAGTDPRVDCHMSAMISVGVFGMGS